MGAGEMVMTENAVGEGRQRAEQNGPEGVLEDRPGNSTLCLDKVERIRTEGILMRARACFSHDLEGQLCRLMSCRPFQDAGGKAKGRKKLLRLNSSSPPLKPSEPSHDLNFAFLLPEDAMSRGGSVCVCV